MGSQTPEVSVKLPQVQKREEFELMCRFIRLGLWGNSNLSRVVGVEWETIKEWKKQPEAQQAYQHACDEVLKKRKKRGDVEKEMKELELDVSNDVLDVNHRVETWTDDELTQFIEAETARRATS